MIPHVDEQARQLRAGLALLRFSKLMNWDEHSLQFEQVTEMSFEEAHAVHGSHGRLLCWIAFSTGAEYLAKAFCLNRGEELRKTSSKVLRLPRWDEDLQEWMRALRVKDNSVFEPQSVKFGQLGSIPLEKAAAGLSNELLILSAFDVLRDAIRNRDAHGYVENVRSGHFHLVGRLFVPAFNSLLRTFGPHEVRGASAS